MRRREVVALRAAAALAAPARGAEARRAAFLNFGAEAAFGPHLDAMRQGLAEMGFGPGALRIETRFAEGRAARLEALATELMAGGPEVFVATGGETAALAAKRVVGATPLVFLVGGDPVAIGLAASLNEPGGTATGMSLLNFRLEEKRLEMLRAAVPGLRTVAALFNPSSPGVAGRIAAFRAGAGAVGQAVSIHEAATDDDIVAAFDDIAREGADAVLVASNPFFFSRHRRIVALAAEHRLPAIYEWREFAEAGGLMSYGTALAEAYREIGRIAGRILAGARPGALPVQQPSRFEFVINLRTARALGLALSAGILARADAVIE